MVMSALAGDVLRNNPLDLPSRPAAGNLATPVNDRQPYDP